MSDADEDFMLAPTTRQMSELALYAWIWGNRLEEDGKDPAEDDKRGGSWVAYQLGLLADLEALTEVKPLPGIDAGRLKRPGSLPYRVAVAEAGIGDSSAVDAAVVADRIRDELRAFLVRRGLLETEDVAISGMAFNANADQPKARHYPVGSRVETRVSPGAFVRGEKDGRAVAKMRGDLTEADALLAEFLESLGAEADAARVRAGGPQTPPWRRWTEGADSGLAPAVLAMVRAVWARILAERARAAKEAEHRAERERKVPVPSMHGVTARVVTGLGRQLDTSALRGLAAGIVAPPEPGRWVQLSETAGDTAGVLAAWLATQAHRQWVSGGHDMADRVEVVASREELVRMGLSRDTSKSPVGVLEDALALLASTRLMGGPDDKQPGSGRLVLDYFLAPKPRVSAKGGRPSAVYVVTIGWPLMPLRLEALAAERGFTVPRELAWYGPVLNPSWAPLTGNARTHRTQQLAFAVGAGQWLVSRREEYAECGGVRLDTLRPFLQSMGLYHRSHASLAEDVAVRWRLPAGQPPLPTLGPVGPLLVATKVEGVYRLGPDYQAQEALVLRSAGVTAKAVKARARQKRVKS